MHLVGAQEAFEEGSLTVYNCLINRSVRSKSIEAFFTLAHVQAHKKSLTWGSNFRPTSSSISKCTKLKDGVLGAFGVDYNCVHFFLIIFGNDGTISFL